MSDPVREPTDDLDARLAADPAVAASIAEWERTAGPPPRPMGCICPPGANKDCENPLCPRKALPR